MMTIKNALFATTLALSAIALPALAKPAAAKPATAPAQAAPAAPAHATPVAAPAAAAKATHLMGTVVSASAKDHALTLKSADGEHTLVVAAKAAIKAHGKAVALAELKAGQKIDATVAKVNGKDTIEAATIE